MVRFLINYNVTTHEAAASLPKETTLNSKAVPAESVHTRIEVEVLTVVVAEEELMIFHCSPKATPEVTSGKVSVCADDPVRNCCFALAEVRAMGVPEVTVVAYPAMKLFADMFELTSHFEIVFAVGVEVAPPAEAGAHVGASVEPEDVRTYPDVPFASLVPTPEAPP